MFRATLAAFVCVLAMTNVQSEVPTDGPTEVPSFDPSEAPSFAPSEVPSFAPSAAPSVAPSAAPSVAPSAAPSVAPSAAPSVAPSAAPSVAPSAAPSVAPSETPSAKPSKAPVPPPTKAPVPSASPSTRYPTRFPSSFAPTGTTWIGRDAVSVVDESGRWTLAEGNLSGLEAEADGSLWGIQNGKSVSSTQAKLVGIPDTAEASIYHMSLVNGVYKPMTGFPKRIYYPNSFIAPDAEDMTLDDDGNVYAATERSNSDKTVKRASILRFERGEIINPALLGVAASREWNVGPSLSNYFDVPDRVVNDQSNMLLEAITWIPDSWLIARNFYDNVNSKTYVISDYPNKYPGVVFVGMEFKGIIAGFVLNPDQTFTKVHEFSSTLYVTNPFGVKNVVKSASPPYYSTANAVQFGWMYGNQTVMSLVFDRDRDELVAHCDDACDNKNAHFKINVLTGLFALTRTMDKPTSLINSNYEGFTIAPDATCINGYKRVFWADDGSGGFFGGEANTVAPLFLNHSIASDEIPCSRAYNGKDSVTAVDDGLTYNTDTGNLSGLEALADGSVWGAINGQCLIALESSVIKYIPSGNSYIIASGYPKLFLLADGKTPDAEDLTFDDAGNLFIGIERTNTKNFKNIKRISIVRYSAASVTGALPNITATNEWNLINAFPLNRDEVPDGNDNDLANLGLEAIVYMPDSWLVAQGFFDERVNATYNPANYPGKMSNGVLFAGCEYKGVIGGFVLMPDNTYFQISNFTSGLIADNPFGIKGTKYSSSGVGYDTGIQFGYVFGNETVVALHLDLDRNHLVVHCDDACNQKNAIFVVSKTTGKFVLSRFQDPPKSLPNSNNEGFTIAPDSTCVNGYKKVFWADDSAGDNTGVGSPFYNHGLYMDVVPCDYASRAPTAQPTSTNPTVAPTPKPTISPSSTPTSVPSAPTLTPSSVPSLVPVFSVAPTSTPSSTPATPRPTSVILHSMRIKMILNNAFGVNAGDIDVVRSAWIKLCKVLTGASFCQVGVPVIAARLEAPQVTIPITANFYNNASVPSPGTVSNNFNSGLDQMLTALVDSTDSASKKTAYGAMSLSFTLETTAPSAAPSTRKPQTAGPTIMPSKFESRILDDDALLGIIIGSILGVTCLSVCSYNLYLETLAYRSMAMVAHLDEAGNPLL